MYTIFGDPECTPVYRGYKYQLSYMFPPLFCLFFVCSFYVSFFTNYSLHNRIITSGKFYTYVKIDRSIQFIVEFYYKYTTYIRKNKFLVVVKDKN